MKTIIVTGAGTGLGKELALLFSKKGYHLLLTGRREETLASAKKEIEETGGKADILTLDIRSSEDISKKMDGISSQYSVYGLVNNAGVGHFGYFANTSEEQIREMLDTNVLGTILMTKTVLPVLVEQGEGLVMNIISTAGIRGKVQEAGYCASKFAVRGFTESLQKEYADTKIKFNAVYMGGMNTPFWEGSDYVKNPSGLMSAKEVAEMIIDKMDQDEIIIEN
ncbi:SDR family oxidoreductase [Neobacillus mesonae]|uniref:SDR family NAD(P)-dependent oxidoreductase n=1 Tax=Neobacillus mesonae TaxID=1193713 RepID=UPI002040F1B1|nr:SDR family oxidoreductase [Neobacillus mesonae]MCM3569438.1 SDR family oxidoreductase [Neobacillus mesonae]